MTETRETSRDALVMLFDTALTGTGNPVQEVIGYKPGADEIKAKSPLVSVTSMGSERPRRTTAGNFATFYLEVETWVLLTDGGSWTPAIAENMTDTIEKGIAGVVADNQETANWNIISYDGPTQVADVGFDGVPYIRETIPIRIEVFK